MGIFDDAKKALERAGKRREVHGRRATQEVVTKKDETNYLGWIKLARTYVDESNLEDTDAKLKATCTEKAVEFYKKAVATYSMEAEPYVFLSKHFEQRNPTVAAEVEVQGLQRIIIENEGGLREIRKAKQDGDKLEILAQLVLLCERYTKRTGDKSFKERLMPLVGGGKDGEEYDRLLALASYA